MHAQATTSQPATLSRSRIPILPRRPKWSFADLKQRFFFGGNSLKSAFIVALSGSFPPGEKEFIQSVRLFMNQVRDPKLISDVQAFIAQEGQHSLQHRLLNEAFRDQKLQVPIRGTLSRPQIDHRKLQEYNNKLIGKATKNVLEKELNRQLDRLFNP